MVEHLVKDTRVEDSENTEGFPGFLGVTSSSASGHSGLGDRAQGLGLNSRTLVTNGMDDTSVALSVGVGPQLT